MHKATAAPTPAIAPPNTPKGPVSAAPARNPPPAAAITPQTQLFFEAPAEIFTSSTSFNV